MKRLMMTAAAIALLSTPAMADITIKQGDWDTTFFPKNTLGEPQCALGTTTSEGMFIVKYLSKEDRIAVEVYSKSWKLTEGQTFKVMVGFNDKYVIEGEVKVFKDGDGGGFLIPGDDTTKLFNGMYSASTIWVGFRGSKPFHWKLSTNGASVAEEQFRMCALSIYAGKTSAPPPLAAEPKSDAPVTFKNGKGGI